MKKSDNERPLLILGSARKAGGTHQLASRLTQELELKVLDLLDYTIHPYNYSGHYPPDDAFQQVAEELLSHTVLVFATPVYWYSMSSYMKVLFDRLTDLVTIQKKLGRQLKGKKVFLLAVGSDEEMPEGFEVPFRRTADYLDMHFIDSYYCPTESLSNTVLAGADSFTDKIMNLTNSR